MSSFDTEIRSGLLIMAFEMCFPRRLSACKFQLPFATTALISSADCGTMTAPRSMSGRTGKGEVQDGDGLQAWPLILERFDGQKGWRLG